jgi:hypothetical protein
MGPPAFGVNVDAERRLRGAQVKVGRVVHVDVDSVLYLDSSQQPMTAWLRASLIQTEPGFCAVRGVLFPDELEFQD